MKTNLKFLFLTFLFFSLSILSLRAQAYLPLKDSFSFGGGIAGGISESQGDYLDVMGDPLCYAFEAEYRHYCIPAFALGLGYRYVGSSKGQSKLANHYIAPTLTARFLSASGRQSFNVSAGAGYLHYQDELSGTKHGCGTFSKGYFGASFNIGYEFAVGAGVGMQVKAEILMADWHFNDDYQPKFNRNDPNQYQSLFDNNLSYLTLCMVLSFGK